MNARVKFLISFIYLTCSFKRIISKEGGFVSAHWDGSNERELKIKNLTKATIRCIPIDNKIEKPTRDKDRRIFN